MIQAQTAIARLRRDLTISSVLKGSLMGSALLCMILEGAVGSRMMGGPVLLALIGGVWLVLSYRSVRGSRIAAVSPVLIAAGNFDQAERHIDEALRSFSLFRSVKLRSLHHLAMLRHAQKRWGETVVLCRALLKHRLGMLGGLTRSTRLLLADASLEVGDLAGAYDALSGLYHMRLSLGEAMELMQVQTEYLARTGAWPEMLRQLPRKVELAELLPGERSARVQAMLALAASKMGRKDWETWLKDRAALLCDVPTLVRERPLLAELWPAESDVQTTVGGSADIR